MSKLNMRARKLNTLKPLPIHRAEDMQLYDQTQYSRNQQAIATGVEKEEETEHHLQAIISNQENHGTIFIPIPDASRLVSNYDDYYKGGFHRAPKLIRVNPADNFDVIYESYDMDEVDTEWLTEHNKENPNKKLTEDQFEQLIGYFESRANDTKSFESLTLEDIMKPSLIGTEKLPPPPPTLIASPGGRACFNYWKQRREKLGRPLQPTLRPETVPNSETDCYVCFRRREIRSIRKSRRNDQQSFDKLCKLREEFDRARQILELVVKRDRLKREAVLLDLLVFDKKLKIWDLKAKLKASGATEQEEQATEPSAVSTKGRKRLIQMATGNKIKLSVPTTKPVEEIATVAIIDNEMDYIDTRLMPERLLGTDPYEVPIPIVEEPIDKFGYSSKDYEDFTEVIEMDLHDPKSKHIGYFDGVIPSESMTKSSRIRPTFNGIRFRRGRGGRMIMDRSTSAFIYRSQSSTSTEKPVPALRDPSEVAEELQFNKLSKKLKFEPDVIDENLLPDESINYYPQLYANNFLSVRLPFFTPQDLKDFSVKNVHAEYILARRQKALQQQQKLLQLQQQQQKLGQGQGPNGSHPSAISTAIERS